MINISFIIIIGKVKYNNLLVYYDHENYVILYKQNITQCLYFKQNYSMFNVDLVCSLSV